MGEILQGAMAMSDVYDIRQRIAEQAQAARAQAEQGYSRVRQGIADALEPRYTRQEELRNKYEWLPPQPTWQYEEYEKVLPAIAESEDPEAMMTRFNMALYYSTYFERPLLDTFENLEFYHEQWMGTRDIPKTYGKALADSFASGFEGMKYGLLGFRQMLSGGEDLELQFALEDSCARMEELEDNVPRAWYQEALKMGFQSIPYTGTALALSALSGGLAGGVAAGLGASSKALAAVKAGAAIIANAPMMQGAEYADLRQQGVRHDIAAPIAAVSGALQSAIEMTLGDTAAIAGNALKQAAPALTNRIVNKLFISGRTSVLGRTAMGALKYAGEALEEGLEESLQHITSITALEIAKAWQGEGVDTQSAEEYGKEIAEAFKGGLLASLVLGVPSGLVRGHFELKEAHELAALAKSTDLPTFIREAKALNPEVLKGANAAQKEAILTETWKAQQARKTATHPPATTQSAQQAANPADLAGIMETTDLAPGTEAQGTDEEPAKTGAVFRTSEGKLYTQFSNRVVKGDTSISGIYKVGDGSRETSRAKTNEENPGNRYGYISYTENGERVTINEFLMDKRREPIRDEFFRDFAAEFSGKEIVWDPKTEEGIAIKEQLVAANPDGPGAGLSYYGTGDIEAARIRQEVSAKIEQYFPRMSPNERAIAVDLLEARANVLEVSLADYTSTYFADGMISDQSAVNMDGKKGAVSFTADVKALIHTTQTADFSTWVHENAHIFRRQLAGDLLTKAEAAFGVQNGVWDRAHEEAFAQGFEDYLREGKAPSTELQTLFGKMAAFLKRIYQNLKNRVSISPEIREVYDAILDKQESGVKPVTPPVVKSNATTGRIWNDVKDLPAPQPRKGYMLFQSKTPDEQMTDVRALYEGTPQWMKAPNGENTRLTEKQWLQVRIPAFKAWFGDWEKLSKKGIHDVLSVNPSDVSVMRDENGEPKVFYHRSPNRFDTFDKNRNGSNTDAGWLGDGFYFYGIEEEGYGYGDNSIAAFLDIKEPYYAGEEEHNELAEADDRDTSIAFTENLIEEGYDGVYFNGDLREEAVAFYPTQIKSATDNSGTFDAENQSILFQDETEEARNTPSRDWPEHFPNVTHFIDTENKYAKPWKELTAHPDYDAAKNHEDLEAAKRLTLDLLKGEAQQKQLWDLGEAYPYAIVVPVHAVEEKSRNRIPAALAGYISQVANLELDESIVQINKVSRTGKGSWYRFVFRPKFEGDVKQGRKYILVDDVFSNGGAFSELRRYIERNGGEVVHMAAMATGGHGEQIALTEKTRLDLEKKFGVASLQQFLQKAGLYGGNYKSLTEPEGYALLWAKTLDEAGNRILEAGQEGNGGLLPGSVQGREAGPLDGILYQTEQSLLEDAMTFETWQEFRDYARFDTETDNDPYIMAWEDTDEWYKIFWNRAHTIAQNTAAETALQIDVVPTKTPTPEAATPSATSPAEMDRRWLEEYTTRENLTDILKTVWNIVTSDDESTQDIKERLNQELRHGSWISNAQRVAKGKSITDRTHKLLSSLMRNRVRDYRALFAELMGTPEWAVALADTTNERLKTRIADPLKIDIDRMLPEQREALAIRLDNEDIARELRKGTLLLDDPRIEKYIKTLQKEIKENNQKYAEWEKEVANDNEHIQDRQVKELLNVHDQLTNAREAYHNHSDTLSRKIDRGIALTKLEMKRAQTLRASYDRLMEHFKALDEATPISTEAQDAIARREALATERAKNKAFKDQRDKIREVNKIRKQLVKRIMRRARPEAVDYEQAIRITTIQRMIEPSLLQGINHFIGSKEKPYLRSLYSQWQTDEEFREKTLKKISSRRERAEVEAVFSKPYEDMTTIEQRDLYRIFGREGWADALGLKDIAKKREANFKLDIKEKNGTVILSPELTRLMEETLPPDMLYRITDKPFGEWTLEEAEQLAKIIDELTVTGKRQYNAKKEARRIQEADARAKIEQTIRNTGIVIEPNDAPEEKERKQAKINKVLGKYNSGVSGTAKYDAAKGRWITRVLTPSYADMNAYRFARIMDNDKTDGMNMALLYRDEDKAFKAEHDARSRREESIKAVLEKNEISYKDLWQHKVSIDLGGMIGTWEFTPAELLGILSADRDEKSREAVMYGNLMDEKELSPYQAGGISEDALLRLANVAEARYAGVLKEANAYFNKDENKKLLALLDAIDRDFDENGDRLNRASIEYFNQPMERVEKYFPMYRRSASGETNEARVKQDLLATSPEYKGATYVDAGRTKSRVTIPKQYQTAINLDLYNVWAKSVADTEHFMAYAGTVRRLNNIYKGRDARRLRTAIEGRYGKNALNFIDERIKEMANPNPETTRDALDIFVHNARGKLASAYLAGRASSIIKQAIASPFPYFQYISPREYLACAFENIRNFSKIRAAIGEKSAHMANRTFDPTIDIIREQQRTSFDKPGSAWARMRNQLMEGLNMVDWVSVAPGWLAVYRNEAARLTQEGKLGKDEIEAAAVEKADDITRLVQPSSRLADMAPLFKGEGRGSELKKAILQFTYSLSPIYQNWRYDLPYAIRNKLWRQAAGTIISYAFAGIALGALSQGFGDDDEPEDRAKQTAFYAMTQFSDSVPLIGSIITSGAERIITGKTQFRHTTNLFPALDALGNTGNKTMKWFEDKNAENAWSVAAQAFETAMLYTGGPISGIKELGSAIGIGDGDGELEFNPSAFLGRRD
jgi:hypothetical protein